MQYHLKFVLFLSFLFGSTLLAESPRPVMLICPPISHLVQDQETLYWSADEGHWRTYSLSFAKKIDRFLGAQWNGANLGTIYCLYRGEAMTFPIKLQFDALAHPPSGAKWSKDLGNFKNCLSSEQEDCPFVPLQKAPPKTLYEQLDDLQKN